MYRKLLLVLSYIGLLSSVLLAQDVVKSRGENWQGATPWKGNNMFLEQYARMPDMAKTDSILFWIPVQFWTYCSDTGEGAVAVADIRKHIEDLNYYQILNQTRIRFYPLPSLTQVNDSRRRQIRWDGEVLAVTRHNNIKGVLNVHLIDSIVKKKFLFFGPIVNNYRGLYNTFTEGVMLKKKTSRSSLTHEVGHFFGLVHTHDYWNSGKSRREAVSRNRMVTYQGRTVRNCEVNGDMLCDTPADPNLTWYVNDSCQFEATNLTDLWGDIYSPDVSNLMAYPRDRECRESYTQSQKIAMLYTAYGNRYHNNWVAYEGVVPDAAEPDNITEHANTIVADSLYRRSLHLNFEGKQWQPDVDMYQFTVADSKPLSVEIVSSEAVEISLKPVQGGEFRELTPGEKIPSGTYFLRIRPKLKQVLYYSIRLRH
ncbi:MAG: hypothetical protein RIS47_431 [Bacteroidota bacterium]